MQRLIILALLLLSFCLGAAISYHNPQVVELNYLTGKLEQPLGVLLVLVAAVTVGIMVLIYWSLTLPQRAERARMRRRLEKAESELANLRTLPLQDG